MNAAVEIPGIKKIKVESVLVRGFYQRTILKVYFKDGTALTFSGDLPRKEAVFNAYYQKGRDAGLTVEEAASLAGKGRVEPLRENH